MHRSKKTLRYHGRSGHPYIHKTENNRSYIMVRILNRDMCIEIDR